MFATYRGLKYAIVFRPVETFNFELMGDGVIFNHTILKGPRSKSDELNEMAGFVDVVDEGASGYP